MTEPKGEREMEILKESLTLILYLCMGYTFLLLIFMLTMFME